MKRINTIFRILVLMLFIVSVANAQVADDNRTKTQSKKALLAVDLGDKYFAGNEYFLASQEYKRAVDADPKYVYALFKLSESFRMHFKYDLANEYYDKLLRLDPKAYPIARYWYGATLKNRGEYEEALMHFTRFLSEADPSVVDQEMIDKAIVDVEGCTFALSEFRKPVRDFNFRLLPAPVNSPESDYAPNIYLNDTTIVITSATAGTIGNRDDGMLGGKKADNFRFTKNQSGQWVKMDDNDGFSIVNSELTEGSGCFTGNKKRFYFSRCDSKGCVILMTKLEQGRWSLPVKLNDNINMKGEWNAQPYVSPHADTLFFVSKRPGGYGMHDIWYSTCYGDDNWGPAINMGPKINTPYIELSPCYYSQEAVLFFSSNGKEGFGGQDIYRASGPGFKQVENIGLPFNSHKDDLYFVLGEKIGYMTSNRSDGLGNDDIYTFNIVSKGAALAEAEKNTKDAKNTASRNDSQSKENGQAQATITKGSTDADAQKVSNANDQKSAPRQNYAPQTTTVAEVKKADLGTDVKSVSITGTIVEADTKKPVADVPSALKGEDGNVIKTTTTNEQGNFRFENLPPANYKVEIEEKNAQVDNKSKLAVKDVEVKHSKMEVRRSLFENIYFDFNDFRLRPEAKKVLDELYQYCARHKEVQVEISAFTDNIGGDEYNQELSRKRGDEASKYLIKKGLDRSVIVTNAKGKSDPLANNISAAGRQLNRRIEFMIVGGSGFEAKAMVYITEPGNTLASVAEQFNMTVSELIALNGFDNEQQLQAHQPVRVKRTANAEVIAPATLAQLKAQKSGGAGKPQVVRNSVPDNGTLEYDIKTGAETFIVGPNNTLFTIARLFGMSVDELMQVNGLQDHTIFVGQRLKVLTPSQGKSLRGDLYIVKEGDTLSSIADKYGLSVEQLMELNRMQGYKLYQNMVLKVK